MKIFGSSLNIQNTNNQITYYAKTTILKEMSSSTDEFDKNVPFGAVFQLKIVRCVVARANAGTPIRDQNNCQLNLSSCAETGAYVKSGSSVGTRSIVNSDICAWAGTPTSL